MANPTGRNLQVLKALSAEGKRKALQDPKVNTAKLLLNELEGPAQTFPLTEAQLDGLQVIADAGGLRSRRAMALQTRHGLALAEIEPPRDDDARLRDAKLRAEFGGGLRRGSVKGARKNAIGSPTFVVAVGTGCVGGLALNATYGAVTPLKLRPSTVGAVVGFAVAVAAHQAGWFKASQAATAAALGMTGATLAEHIVPKRGVLKQET